MIQIDGHQLASLFQWNALVDTIGESFKVPPEVPLRHHHLLGPEIAQGDSMLLLMPAWSEKGFLGVKLLMVSPGNRTKHLATIQGIYQLFDVDTGLPLAQIDAPVLTNFRTAAASALASRFLSRHDSKSLLVIGTGSLAPFMARAHAAVRPIRQIYIWGRNRDRARDVGDELIDLGLSTNVVDDLPKTVAEADLISTVTSSADPVVLGAWLKPGQHLDLVGSYQKHMRECDDEAIRKSKVFVDTPHALEESGDLHIPLKKGILNLEHIGGDLLKLSQGHAKGRQSSDEVTLFKSVGHASEDLAAAVLAYKAYLQRQQ